jgi:4-hydroxy-3-polyprenylbenzoate decarboxylase
MSGTTAAGAARAGNGDQKVSSQRSDYPGVARSWARAVESFVTGILIWNELEGLGIPNIIGVNYSWGMTIIAIKQAYPGHAMRAAHGALGGTAGYHGRFVIVVDDDIDPFDLHDVMWALATRCDPETSLDVCRRIWSYKIDPRLPKHKKEAADYTCAVAIIDA